MATIPISISIDVKRKCIEMAKDGKTSKEIYIEYYSLHHDTKYESFKRNLKRWKKESQCR